MFDVLERGLIVKVRWHALFLSHLLFWWRSSHVVVIINFHFSNEVGRTFVLMRSTVSIVLGIVSIWIKALTLTVSRAYIAKSGDCVINIPR